jgi:hypothetical protein
MTEQRLTEQLQLVFTSAEDAQSSVVGGDAESVVAKREPERPAVTNSVMEAVCERENLKKALRRVRANKGSPGVDGMTVEQPAEAEEGRRGLSQPCLCVLRVSKALRDRPVVRG